MAISVENIGIASSSSTREEAARKKKVVLGVEPINGFDFLLDWYLHSQSKGFTKIESEPGMNRLEVTLVMCAGKEYSTRRSFVLFVVKPWETPS